MQQKVARPKSATEGRETKKCNSRKRKIKKEIQDIKGPNKCKRKYKRKKAVKEKEKSIKRKGKSRKRNGKKLKRKGKKHISRKNNGKKKSLE